MKKAIIIMLGNNQLSIVVEERVALLEFGSKRARVDLRKKPILWGIDKVTGEPRDIKSINVRIKDASFSITRQVVTAVNTLAWQLGIKVNGKRQMSAEYSREPNITVKTKV